jgi:hypothetical protein
MKNWRISLAKLQTSINSFIFQPTENNVKDWYIKNPGTRPYRTHTPYDHRKWKRAHSARLQLARLIPLLANTSTLAYTATPINIHKEGTHFDSDSFPIMVDNGASYCISNNLSDFITPPTEKGE